MIVLLRPELFGAASVRSRPFYLEALIYECLGRHQLVADFDVEADPGFLAWRRELGAAHRDALGAALRHSLTALARTEVNVSVVAGPPGASSSWESTPPILCGDDLLNLLRSPLHFLVEHAVHDGEFLRTVGTGVDGDNFRLAVSRGEIVFDHGGGSDMRTLLTDRSANRVWSHRAWVVFDSDGLFPKVRSREAELKISTCEAARVAFHVLFRRSIENYIPPADLDEYVGKGDRRASLAVGAFGRMSANQRAHYNMKRGFDGDQARLEAGDSAWRPQVDALFDGISAADKLVLQQGFGQNIARCFVEDADNGRPRIPEARRIRDNQHLEFEPLFRRIVSCL
jgi:hypothetical protein